MKTNKLVPIGALRAATDCQVQNAIRNGDTTVPMTGRTSQPPIPFGPSVAVGEAAVVETSVIEFLPLCDASDCALSPGTKTTAPALAAKLLAGPGALHRLGALDLDRATDEFENGGRRLDQGGDDPLQLLAAARADLEALPRGVLEEGRVGERRVEGAAQRRDPLARHAGIGHDRARDHDRARNEVEHALLVGGARERAQERHLLEQREPALAGLD